MLILYDNAFGDRGLAALLAPPHAGALARLASLDLDNCPVGDAGCAELAAALGCAEAMPALSELSLHGTKASEAAVAAVVEARVHMTLRI